MMGYGWGMGPAGWIFMSLFWIALIGLVVWAAVELLPGTRAARGHDRPEGPEEILDRRFALGELDAEQYRRARQELSAARADRR
jgi:putative membrane protein